MKTIGRNFLIFISPILLVILINEYSKTQIKNMNNKLGNILTINPGSSNKIFCTWKCHNSTEYCKQYHVKLVENYFEFTDPVYFGIIQMLNGGKTGSTGSFYRWMNVIFLVLGIPILIFFFFIKGLDYSINIKNIRKIE